MIVNDLLTKAWQRSSLANSADDVGYDEIAQALDILNGKLTELSNTPWWALSKIEITQELTGQSNYTIGDDGIQSAIVLDTSGSLMVVSVPDTSGYNAGGRVRVRIGDVERIFSVVSVRTLNTLSLSTDSTVAYAVGDTGYISKQSNEESTESSYTCNCTTSSSSIVTAFIGDTSDFEDGDSVSVEFDTYSSTGVITSKDASSLVITCDNTITEPLVGKDGFVYKYSLVTPSEFPDLVSVRPSMIQSIKYNTGNIFYPVCNIPTNQWDDMAIDENTTGYPTKYRYIASSPYGIIDFGAPTLTGREFMISYKSVIKSVDLNTDLSLYLSPEHIDALIYVVADLICVDNNMINQRVSTEAFNRMRNIRIHNTEAAKHKSYREHYDWRSGQNVSVSW